MTFGNDAKGCFETTFLSPSIIIEQILQYRMFFALFLSVLSYIRYCPRFMIFEPILYRKISYRLNLSRRTLPYKIVENFGLYFDCNIFFRGCWNPYNLPGYVPNYYIQDTLYSIYFIQYKLYILYYNAFSILIVYEYSIGAVCTAYCILHTV